MHINKCSLYKVNSLIYIIAVSQRLRESRAAGSRRSKIQQNSYNYIVSNRFHTATPGATQEDSIVWILVADIRERRATKARVIARRVIALRSRRPAVKAGGNPSPCVSRSVHTPSSLSSAHQHRDTHTWHEDRRRTHAHAHGIDQKQQLELISAALRLHVTEQHWTPNGECCCVLGTSVLSNHFIKRLVLIPKANLNCSKRLLLYNHALT